MITCPRAPSTWSAASTKWSRRPRRSPTLRDLTGPLRLEDAVNAVCPWSGDPISADALTEYRGAVVGFCNTGCRDKFAAATRAFDEALETR
jgi:hypothetical protein